MDATTEVSPIIYLPDPPTDRAPAVGLDAGVLADLYLRYVSSMWRGDADAQAFGVWLRRHWCAHMPPIPTAPPAAVSPHGGAGHGIRWYVAAGEIVGYVSGSVGGYRVPVDDVPPTLG